MRLHLSAALWEQPQWYKVNWSSCRCQGAKDGDIHFELKDTTGINRGHILAQMSRLAADALRDGCQSLIIAFNETDRKLG
jgi:hypothetical protein